MKKLFLSLALAAMVACAQPSTTPMGNPAEPTATPSFSHAPTPTASASPTVVTPPVALLPVATPGADCTARFGVGKETYCHIYDAWVAKYPPQPGKLWSYRDPVQWADYQKSLAYEGNGLPGLIRKFGCDPKGWGPRVKIPMFGPFTGAQHEFGGNEYLVIANQLAGQNADDLAHWLLYGNYDRQKHYVCNGVTLK